MKLNFIKNIIVVATVFSLVFSPVFSSLASAEVMSSGNYGLQSDSLNFGGGNSSSGSYGLESTVGEVGTGDLSGTSYNAFAGYQQSSSTTVAVTPTTPTTDTDGSSSGSRPYPINPINFFATPKTNSINLSWQYSGSTADTFRVVRSDTFFPNDISDGEVIFEGDALEIIDYNVNVGTRYYYALFAKDIYGRYSSGVLAQARITPAGEIEKPVTAEDIFKNVPDATNIHESFSKLTLLDFDFIQGGVEIEHVDNVVSINGKEELTISLDYHKVPEILKTIAVTLIDPDDATKFFTFLLRVNKNKTAYEATIGALGKSGNYKINVTILDYKNQGLKRITGDLKAFVFGGVKGLLNNYGVSININLIIIILLIIIAIIVAFVLSRRYKRVFAAFLIFAFIFSNFAFYTSSAHAAINKQINYQGKLVDSSGDLVTDGTYAMEFKLYTVSSGGSAIYTETLSGVNEVQVTNGLFSVMLGAVSSLSSVDFNQTLYLGVNVESDGEMTPRKIIGAVPSAFVAEVADTLDGLDSTQFLRSDIGSVTSGYFVSTTTNATSTFAGGIDLSDGCFAIDGVCLSAGGSSYTNADANAYIHASSTIPKTYTANTFTALQTFNYASTTAITSTGSAYFATTDGGLLIGTTTATSTSKLTLAGGNFLHTAVGNPTFKGSYDTTGFALDVYISGKYAYVADDSSGLQIIDISNPASPSLVGTYDTSGTSYGVHVSGKYAYVADIASGLQIIDVSNSSAPSLVGTYNTSGSAIGVYVSGKYAYVADNDSGLHIIDISNPTAPTLKGTYNTSGNAFGVYVSGKYAYVADYLSGLHIIDISNPTSPSLVGTYNTSGFAQDVYVSGRYAYVADDSSGLQIIDISNPASPSLVGTYDTAGAALDVYISGKYAYVADNASGLQIIDISNPTAPSFVGTYDTSANSQGIYVSGKYAYIADDNSGLQILDINGIETPSLYAGNIETNVLNATENIIAGGDIYAQGGLNVGISGIFSRGTISAFIASTTQTNPIVATFMGGNVGIGTTTPYSKLSVWGSSNGTARLFELTNSASTTLASFLENGTGYFLGNIGVGTTSPYAKLSVVGQAVASYFTATTSTASTFPYASTTAITSTGSAYFATTDGGLLIGTTTATSTSKLTLAGGNFLHTAVGNPTLKGTYDTFLASGVYVSGKYAYIADYSSGLNIIDVSNPSSPLSVGTYDTTGYSYAVQVSGKYAYVADEVSGLQIIDVSNPTSPSLVGTYDTTFAGDVYVSGKYAYVADGGAGLQIIDVSNPSSPSLAGTYNTSGSAIGVYVSGKYAYVADDTSGIHIIDISNSSAPSLMGTYNTTGNATDVYVSGKYAYVSDGASGIHIINISNPSSPSLVSTYNTPHYAAGLYVSGKYVYLGDSSTGLQVIDVSNPSSPSLVGTYDSSGTAFAVYVSGKYAYLADYLDGLKIIDINGIETPSLYAGNIETNVLNATENIIAGGDIYAQGGLNVGISGIFSRGTISAFIASTTQTNPVVATFMGGNVGIGTTSPYAKLSVVGEIVGSYFTATTTATSTFGGSIAVTETNATSTFAGGIDLSDGCFAIDGVCLGGSSYGDTNVNAYIHASTTIPKTYTANTFTALQTFNYASTTAISASATIKAGTSTVSNSVDSVISIMRSVDNSVTGNGHAFSDSSQVNRTGTIGYNSFDARINIVGTQNYDHYAAFQALPSYDSSGTMTNYYGLFSGLNKTAGTITNAHGVYVDAITGGTNNYGIYVEDNNSVFRDDSAGEGIPLTVTNNNGGDSSSATLAFNNASTNAVTGKISSFRVGSGNYAMTFQNFGATGLFEAMRINNSGNVGIGTTSPYAKLSVVGPVVAQYFHATSTTATSTIGGSLVVGGPRVFSGYSVTGGLGNIAAGDAQAGTAINASGQGAFAYGQTTSSLGGSSLILSSGQGSLAGGMTTGVFGSATTTSSGVGSVAWGYAVAAGPGTSANLTSSGTGSIVLGAASNKNLTSSAIGSFAGGYASAGNILSSADGAFAFGDNITASAALSTAFGSGFTNSTANSFMVGYGSTPTLTVNATNVGIGTTSPYAKLSVVGPVVAEYFNATSTTATSTFLGGVAIGGPFRGQVSPYTKVEFSDPTGGYASDWSFDLAGGGFGTLNFGASGGTYSSRSVRTLTPSVIGTYQYNTLGMISGRTWDGTAFKESSAISFEYDASLGTNDVPGAISFYTSADGTATPRNRMMIRSSGNVGIGTTSPYAILTTWGTTTGKIFEAVTSASTTALSISATGFATTTVSGLTIAGSATSTSNVGFNLSGGCFAVNGTCLGGSSYGDTDVNAYIHASTTIPKTYTANTFTALQTFTSGLTTDSLTIGSLTGPLQAIAGVVSASSTLSVAYGGTGWSSFLSGYIPFGNGSAALATSSSFYWDNTNGRLGIGTSSPYAKLSVVGPVVAEYFHATSTTATSTIAGGLDVNGGGLLYDFNTGITSIGAIETGAFNFDTDAGQVNWVNLPVTSSAVSGLVQSYTASIADISLLTLYAEATGVDNTVRKTAVGIGSTTPMALLTIQNNAFTASSTYDFFIASTTANFATTTHFAIMNTGNVGVATSTPWGLLSVEQGTEGASFVVSNTGSTTPSFIVSGVNGNGNVGVGTSTPWKTLSVTGTVAIDGLTAAGASGDALCLGAGKEVQVNTGAQTCTVSSARFKNTIAGLDIGLEALNKLNPVSFIYNGSTENRIGFIAEEVGAVDKRLIFTEADGVTPRGVRYEDMVAVLAKAIKEQQVQINAFQSATSTNTHSTSTIIVNNNTNSSNSSSNLSDEAIATITSNASAAALSGVADLFASSTILNNLASSTGALIVGNVADTLASSTPSFISRIASAVIESLKSSTEWVFAKITATLAIFDRVETKTLCIGETCVNEDQLKALLAKIPEVASTTEAVVEEPKVEEAKVEVISVKDATTATSTETIKVEENATSTVATESPSIKVEVETPVANIETDTVKIEEEKKTEEVKEIVEEKTEEKVEEKVEEEKKEVVEEKVEEKKEEVSEPEESKPAEEKLE